MPRRSRRKSEDRLSLINRKQLPLLAGAMGALAFKGFHNFIFEPILKLDHALPEFAGDAPRIIALYNHIRDTEYPATGIAYDQDDAARHLVTSAIAHWKYGDSLGTKLMNGHEAQNLADYVGMNGHTFNFLDHNISIFVQLSGAMDFYNNHLAMLLLHEMERRGLEITEESIIRASLNLICQQNTPVITNRYQIFSEKALQELDKSFAEILGAEMVSTEYQNITPREVIENWPDPMADEIDGYLTNAIMVVLGSMPRKEIFNEQYVTDKTVIVLPEWMGQADEKPIGLILSPQTPEALRSIQFSDEVFNRINSQEQKECIAFEMQQSSNTPQLTALNPHSTLQTDPFTAAAMSSLVIGNAATTTLRRLSTQAKSLIDNLIGNSR